MKLVLDQLKEFALLKAEHAKEELRMWRQLSSAVEEWSLKPEKEKPAAQEKIIPAPHTPGAFLSIKDAVEYLGLSTASIYRLFNAGDLKKVKFGTSTRIKRSDLESYIARSSEL